MKPNKNLKPAMEVSYEGLRPRVYFTVTVYAVVPVRAA